MIENNDFFVKEYKENVYFHLLGTAYLKTVNQSPN